MARTRLGICCNCSPADAHPETDGYRAIGTSRRAPFRRHVGTDLLVASCLHNPSRVSSEPVANSAGIQLGLLDRVAQGRSCNELFGVPGHVQQDAGPFVVLFGGAYFFSQFGPNTTTFVYPSEIFPVEVRTTGNGIASGGGEGGRIRRCSSWPTRSADVAPRPASGTEL